MNFIFILRRIFKYISNVPSSTFQMYLRVHFRCTFEYISDVPSSTFQMYLRVHFRCTFEYISDVPRPGWAAFVMPSKFSTLSGAAYADRCADNQIITMNGNHFQSHPLLKRDCKFSLSGGRFVTQKWHFKCCLDLVSPCVRL